MTLPPSRKLPPTSAQKLCEMTIPDACAESMPSLTKREAELSFNRGMRGKSLHASGYKRFTSSAEPPFCGRGAPPDFFAVPS